MRWAGPSRMASFRTRFPVNADAAIAEIAGGTGISPIPVGGFSLATRYGSIRAGDSRIRTGGSSVKFFWTTRP